MPFEIEIGGNVFRTDDLTIVEAERLEEQCGKTWLQLNPLRSAKEFRATAILFLCRTLTPDVAAKEADAITIKMAQDSTRWVDDNLPTEFVDGLPKAAGVDSTPTSSVSPDPLGDGPPT